MQLSLSDIHQEITPAKIVLKQEWLGEVLSKPLLCGFSTERSQSVVVDTQRIGLEIMLQSHFVLQLTMDCSLCMRSFELKVPVDFSIALKPMLNEKVSLPEELELSSKDMEKYCYEGEAIDLGEILREQIIIALPMYPRCSQNCKGLCPVCGADLNLEPCECDREHFDPRWAALKNISKH